MNPESVTTTQLFSNFTARHWVATISTTFASFGAIAYGGYWVGQKFTETQMLLQQAELRSLLAKLQTNLDVSQQRIEQLSTVAIECKNEYMKQQTNLSRQQQENVTLNAQLGKASNSSFIREQIVETQRQIERLPGNGVFLSRLSKEDEESEKVKKLSLQRRLEVYQQQLGLCK